ncbi:doublecortin domain-containing protein 2 isoform X1 [Callorhinchus milii]|uniref:Doublecortin domain-containing protein 2-like n=2 Tax=Callorhinchus milii TaxID=7868 RepID=A0A4W3HGL4_CALMI|nr:doublecortin domain-containing protein 2 isoform X1 [Callorhinchus milii]|eukprot:gi/632972991/ref/XP_007902931.1/ PREDICTED: doublecortin domain-containing protein 2-like isoform X1 [Callorhinchus milii]
MSPVSWLHPSFLAMATASRGVLSQPPAAKSVIVYRNGDPFFTGRRFLINYKQVSTFDNFLNQVTRGINAPFGAVRSIYTPRDGHRVLDLDDLQNGASYVAAGAEKFKTLDYLQITTKKPQRKKSEMIRPVVHSRIVVSARWRKYNHEPCTINIFTNGDLLIPPVRLLIPKYISQDWNRVLAMVTEKIHLRTGAVQRLCTLDGISLLGAAELDNTQYYVAVGSEKFKKLPYYQVLSKKMTARETPGFHSELLPPIRRGRKVRERSEDDSTHSPGDGLMIVGPSQALKGHSEELGAKAAREENTIFRAKPVKIKCDKPAESPLSGYEENGVFKAQDSRKETEDAVEVREDADTGVDLPIDQVPAEIVHEEEILANDNTVSTAHHKNGLDQGDEGYWNSSEQYSEPNGWAGDEDGVVESVKECNKNNKENTSNSLHDHDRTLGKSNTETPAKGELHRQQEDRMKEGSQTANEECTSDVPSGTKSSVPGQKEPAGRKSDTQHGHVEMQHHVEEALELEKAPRGQEKFRKRFGFHFRRSAKSKEGSKDNK